MASLEKIVVTDHIFYQSILCCSVYYNFVDINFHAKQLFPEFLGLLICWKMSFFYPGDNKTSPRRTNYCHHTVRPVITMT